MGNVLDLAERFWQGGASIAAHPFTTFAGIEELAPGLAFVSTFANIIAVETGATDTDALVPGGGLALFDTGSQMAAKAAQADLRRWSKNLVHTAVYTHGHVDHVMGTALYDAERSAQKLVPLTVIAHEAVPERFDRYTLTAKLNEIINRRQFQVPVSWPREYRTPDRLYRKDLLLSWPSVTANLHHARGETDDGTWAWLPESRVLVTGDLFIWCTPNCGNPQKVQRYPGDWAAALRAMATLPAEILLPGHGPPILGAARVHQALTETALVLESLHDKTVAAMNAGATLDQILHEVHAPPALLDRPFLRPLYDDPQFIVRNVWRLYGGWYDGNPAHLKPAPDADLARELAAIAGGASGLATRALTLADSGRLDLAAHFAEWAVLADPTDASAKAVRADVYRQRSEAEASLMARNIFRSAAER